LHAKRFSSDLPDTKQGVRRAVGNQAKVLNTMILQSMPESFSADASDADLLTYAEGQAVASEGESLEGVMEERKKRDASMNRAAKKCITSDVFGIVDVPLKESVGHTKLEVLVGGTWGVLCTLALSHLLPHLLIQ
jgi:acid phosphatase family membrane protein YuiD